MTKKLSLNELKYIPVSEAARRLMITPCRVRQLIKEGKITAIKQTNGQYQISEEIIEEIKTRPGMWRKQKETKIG